MRLPARAAASATRSTSQGAAENAWYAWAYVIFIT